MEKDYDYVAKGKLAKEIIEEIHEPASQQHIELVKKARKSRIKRVNKKEGK